MTVADARDAVVGDHIIGSFPAFDGSRLKIKSALKRGRVVARWCGSDLGNMVIEWAGQIGVEVIGAHQLVALEFERRVMDTSGRWLPESGGVVA